MTNKKTEMSIAEILETSVTVVHNTYKRGFNNLINKLLKTNTELTMLDIMLELMRMFDMDETIIKMLNRKNKAKLAVELAKNYKLVQRGDISTEAFDKFVTLSTKLR